MAGPKQRLGFAYRFVASIVRPILRLITRPRWEGGDRIPPVGTGVVVVANHISHLDPLTFAHFLWDNGRATRYLAKDSLFRIPVVGKLVAACGQIPVYRTGDAARAYRDAVKAVEAGECVAIYPEGTITRDPGLWPMVGKTGAARVALETGCEVLPMAQWGVHNILPPYAKRPRLIPRKDVYVRVGDPVDLEDLRGQQVNTAVMRAATDRIMAAVVAELEKIRGESAPEVRFDMRATPADKPTDDEPRDDERPGDEGSDDEARGDGSNEEAH